MSYYELQALVGEGLVWCRVRVVLRVVGELHRYLFQHRRNIDLNAMFALASIGLRNDLFAPPLVFRLC